MADLITLPCPASVPENKPRRGRLPKGVASIAAARERVEDRRRAEQHAAAARLWDGILELAEEAVQQAVSEAFQQMRYKRNV